MYTKVFHPATKSFRDAQYNAEGIEQIYDRVQTSSAVAKVSTDHDAHVVEYIYIDSAMRSLSQYPNPNSFVVDLGAEYRNIHTVRLLQGTFPNVESISSETAVFLDIKELNTIKIPQSGMEATALVQLSSHVSNNFLNLDIGPCIDVYKRFLQLKDKLARLTISLRNKNGNLISLGPNDNWAILLEIRRSSPQQLGTGLVHAT